MNKKRPVQPTLSTLSAEVSQMLSSLTQGSPLDRPLAQPGQGAYHYLLLHNELPQA